MIRDSMISRYAFIHSYRFFLFQEVHLRSPFDISHKYLKLLFHSLRGGQGANGGVETLLLDINVPWDEILDEAFPPAAEAWMNLRKIHLMSSPVDTDIDRLMSHLYKNG